MNRVWCKDCQNHVDPRNNGCPSRTCHGSTEAANLIVDVIDTALDVATAVAVAHVTGDIFSGAADVVSSLFDW